MKDTSKYEKDYSESGLWSKLDEFAKKIGGKLVGDALKLFYLMKSGKLNAGQKAAVIGALGYLIAPVDVIPDILPGGFVDDAAVIAGVLKLLAELVNAEIKTRVNEKLKEYGFAPIK